MTDSLNIFVSGHPVPWKRTGRNGKRSFTVAKDRSWRFLVKRAALVEAGARKAARDAWDIDGWFLVSLSFGFADDGRLSITDSDNLVKGVLDACKGVLWADDARVQLGPCPRSYSDQPGVRIEVTRIDAPRKTLRMLEAARLAKEAARVARNESARMRRAAKKRGAA